jgi:hypothetical protein
MAKAPAEQVNNEDIYKSLIMAYKANIGEISNNITKIWNSDNINLDVIKWLCMENNFTIDFAKTLYMPKRPDHVNKIISSYIKAKVPHFFIYAKDKEVSNVEPLNNSTVNKLNNIILNKRINFVRVVGKFDYKMLMKNIRVELNESIIESYIRLDRNKKAIKRKKELKSNDELYIYKVIRSDLLLQNCDGKYVTDVLVKYLYSEKRSRFKTTLWESFGDVIINNLRKHIFNFVECDDCGCKIESPKHKQTRCDDCQHKRDKEKHRLRQRKYILSKK